MASQFFTKRERARDAGQASETRQMAEQEQAGEGVISPLAFVLVLLGIAAVVVLWLVTR